MRTNRAILAALACLAMTTVVGAAGNDELTLDKESLAILQKSVEHKMVRDQVNADQVTLTLEHVLAMASMHNRDIKVAEEKYEQARIAVSAAGAIKNPKISYDYGIAKQYFSPALQVPLPKKPINPKDMATATTEEKVNAITKMLIEPPTMIQVDSGKGSSQSLNVTLPIYTGGAAEGAIQAARYGREIAKASLLKTREEAKLNAASMYYKYILGKEKEAIANESVQNLNAHLRHVNAHYEAGTVAKSDVLATKVALSQAQTTAIQAQNGVALAEAALNNILGLPLGTKLITPQNELTYAPYPLTLEEVKGYALAHRVELVQAALAVKVAEERVMIAAAEQKPKVGASVASTWKSEKDFSANDSRTTVIGAKVSFNLWDGGTTSAKIAEAKSQVQEAKENNDKAIDGVLLEVSDAYLSLKSTEQMLVTTNSAVEQAQENFKIASVRYLAGVGTNLDVLDAELKLEKARIDYKENLFNYNKAMLTLEKAMGIVIDKDVMNKVDIVRDYYIDMNRVK